jgi:predicted small metal-binding protein
MPSITCRDTGIGDWYYDNPDLRNVFEAAVEHIIAVHEPLMKEVEAIPIWQVAFQTAERIKGFEERPAHVSCRDLGLDDDWNVRSENSMIALIELLKHWETAHKEHLAAEFRKRRFRVIKDLMAAIKEE